MSVDEVYPYAAIVLLALTTVLTRAGFLLIGDYIPLPERVRRALRFAPIAGLTAIIVPVLLPWDAASGPQFDLRLVAAMVAVIVFIRTRNAFMLIASGMVALWCFRWLVGLIA